MSIPSGGGLPAAAAGTAQSVSVAEDSDRLLRPKDPEIERDDVDTDDEDVGELKGVSDDELADREFVPNMPSVNDKSRVGTRYLYPNDPGREWCGSTYLVWEKGSPAPNSSSGQSGRSSVIYFSYDDTMWYFDFRFLVDMHDEEKETFLVGLHQAPVHQPADRWCD